MKEDSSFQEIWEKKYASGHQSFYPWDIVVSFIYRNRCKSKKNSEHSVLEVGFGTGNNLWFAAREGFKVSGVEGSHTAVSVAKKRFAQDELSGDLRTGNFTKLPFEDDYFDLAFDRGSLTCVNKQNQNLAIQFLNFCIVISQNQQLFHQSLEELL